MPSSTDLGTITPTGKEPRQSITWPRVTVIIPVRNERERILRCLDQILAQSYPKDRLEVLIVDGDSDDGTRELLDRALRDGTVGEVGSEGGPRDLAASNGRPSVRVLRNPKRQRASGLNIGIKAATGDVIARIDARSSVLPHYVEQCVRTLAETEADNVGGVQTPMARTASQEAIGTVLSHPFGVGNAAFRLGRKSGDVDTVYLGCFRREVFERVGLFDEESIVISEDSDINQRIRQAGGRVYLNANIHAYYEPRETLGAFWRIAFRYGGARAGNLVKHRRLTSWRQAIPPAVVLGLVSLLALSLWDRRLLMPLIGIAAVYLLADAAISLVLSRRRRRWGLAPRLLLAFPCMHFGWGLGFWTRLLLPQRPGIAWRG